MRFHDVHQMSYDPRKKFLYIERVGVKGVDILL